MAGNTHIGSINYAHPKLYRQNFDIKDIVTIIGIYGDSSLDSIVKIYYKEYPKKVDKYRKNFWGNTRSEEKIYRLISTYIGKIVDNVMRFYRVDKKYRFGGTDFRAIYQAQNDLEKNKMSPFFENSINNGIKIYNLTKQGILVHQVDNPPSKHYKDDDIDITTNGKGIVYLLESDTFPGTYKIGMTRKTIEYRLRQLQKDNRYGVFNLKIKMYVKCDNYELIEKILHRHFRDYRLNKKNKQNVDTELFKHDSDIGQEFKTFIEELQEKPTYKIHELIEK